jgi:sulfofructose kinase
LSIDVVGLGLNATDIVITVREVPPLGGKEKIVEEDRQAGGQVATAIVACQRLGLRTRYVGNVGDDEGGRFQLASLKAEGIDIRFVRMIRNTPNQVGYIIVDQKTGERTVYWGRSDRLRVKAREIAPKAISQARALHIDGCDVDAALKAARIAHAAGIPVVADLDTVYKGVERLLPFIDYLIASSNFPAAFTGIEDPCRALQQVSREFGLRAAGMTLGREGALILSAGKFHYSPGFVVETVDTTGAGDVFHGGFIYALLKGWEMPRVLDFANAMAALNCTRMGARGGIATAATAARLVQRGARHVRRDLARLG